MIGPLREFDRERLEAEFAALEDRACIALMAEGVERDSIRAERSLDLRYQGQSYTLNVTWQGIEDAEADFHSAHEHRFGHRLDTKVELVNVRVGTASPPPDIRLQLLPSGTTSLPCGEIRLHGINGNVGLWSRDSLVPGQKLFGPALITETVATTFVAPGWRCLVDPVGNLIMESKA